MLLELIDYKMYPMNQKRAKDYLELTKWLLIGGGLTWILLWAFFWRPSVKNWHEYQLIKYSETTAGELVDTFENEAEDARGRVKSWKSGVYKYVDSKGKKHLVFSGAYKGSIPNEVRVRFLPSNPSISDIEGEGPASLKQFGIVRIILTGPVLLCMLCAPGFVICRNAYREWALARRIDQSTPKQT